MKKILFAGNKNIISAQLRQQRKSCGLSQSQLAARMQTLGVNIDQQMISKIEKNARFVTDYELLCFCRILHISADQLLRLHFDSEESRS